jgi:hypothetical protein
MDQLMPEDLLKYGLIPEFVGRLPVVVGLTRLTQEDLIKVLTEPKNAVTRQFAKFLSLDRVELVFTADALEATARLAIDRKTGARALPHDRGGGAARGDVRHPRADRRQEGGDHRRNDRARPAADARHRDR